MEFSLDNFECVLPVEITIDDDNGRYMVRKSDTSGVFFNSPSELISWIKAHLKEEEFLKPDAFRQMLGKLDEYEQSNQ
ncbi:hypothetical protein D1B31_06515 [Neobacillus notoginsengisoli]|uniref:Threonine dehydratase n=1 Tax=Neobacillus notoginsengisoli TaxID=1578198 RepID=A0A417YXQ7_9BACI|nr:hypothetical protein [Neobacillus notoginsengisoli]RHW42270.1 hypothetical protein D1B31_06515 [Neobacillus notoginsengisoli]